MANPGNDFHRRDADALKQDELIRGAKQQKRNAAEWLRRARVALNEGNYTLMSNLAAQATLEVQTIR